jgi:glycosyltransferase involved in cell wall biosynthesis
MACEGRKGPTISVIIPVFNCAKYVGAALRSCIEQIDTSDEIIVVDDGSVDGTAEVLQGFDTHPRVRVQHQTNRGVSAARNAGVRASTGTFAVFLDADDELLGHALQQRRRAIISHPDVDVFLSDYWISDAPGLKRSAHRALDVDSMLAAYADSAGGDTISLGSGFAEAYATSKVAHSLVHTSGITIRRTLFDRTGGFAPELRIAEDYDLWSRCFAIGRVALLTGEPQSVYFRWRGSIEKYEAACQDSVRRLRGASEIARPFSPGWHRIRRQMAYEYLTLIYWLGVESATVPVVWTASGEE